MAFLAKYLKSVKYPSTLILEPAIPISSYWPIDLSVDNHELNNYNVKNPTECQSYISSVLRANSAQVAYGGYLEKRNLYADKSNFLNNEHPRNIHLGIDFWAKAGTKVIVPLGGIVHSFQNNKTVGDYGPTIVLKHQHSDCTFHTLYGHLSVASLANLQIGMHFKKGDTLAALGTPDINVNYAPHLHFQIIEDMGDNLGDYPGVCSSKSMTFYSKNCPDPNLLLRIGL